MSKKKTAEETPSEKPEEKVAEKQEKKPQVKKSKKEDFLKKYEELNDTHLRLMAEFDNYRKRTLREKADLMKTAGESLLLNILPLMDDFDRGLKAMDDASDITAVKEGIELIHGKFKDFLKQQGVSEIDSIEQQFDTEFHEAITTIPAPVEDLKGKVIDCTQKGYTLNEKVIRYSQVVVGE